MEEDNYILVDKTHRNSNVYNILYERYDDYFIRMEEDHGLRIVRFTELEVPPNCNLFKVVDKIKSLKFVFDNGNLIKKPEKKFSL